MTKQLVSATGTPLQTPVVDHAAELYRESMVIALSLKDKPLVEWTNADKFAAALVAGAAMVFNSECLETLHPVNITPAPNGRFKVAQVVTPHPVRPDEAPMVVPTPNLLEPILAAKRVPIDAMFKDYESGFECPECGCKAIGCTLMSRQRQKCLNCGWIGAYITPPTSGADAKTSLD